MDNDFNESEFRERYPLIARPPEADPVAVRGISTSTADSSEPAAPTLPPSTSPSPTAANLVPTKPVIPSSPLEQQTEADRRTQQRLGKGSGISQIGNPWARGALRGLNIAGEIGSALIPQIGTALRAIPGTEEHHQVLVNRNTKALTADEEQAEKEAQTARETAQAGAVPSEVALREAQTKAAGEAKQKEEKWSEFTNWTDTDGTPLIREENSGQVVRASDKKVPAGFKAAAAPKPERPDAPEQQLIDAEAAVAAAKTPEEKTAARTRVEQLKQSLREYASATQKPDKPGSGDARSDRSYQYNSGVLDKEGKPVEDAVARLGRLRDTIAQGSPQADALVAPELLTVMAGGAGSGLRMNEAEIARIVGGRSQWESLKAHINQWSLDPSKANSITPEQRQQIHALVDIVHKKLIQKQQILDNARGALIEADDPKEHRTIVQEARRNLSRIDEGGATGKDLGAAPAGQAEGATGTLDDGTTVVVKGGRLVAQ